MEQRMQIWTTMETWNWLQIIDEPARFWQSMVSDKKMKNHNYANIILKGSEKNQSGLGLSIILTHQGKSNFNTWIHIKGYLSTMQNIHHFGLGKLRKIDSIEIIMAWWKIRITIECQCQHLHYGGIIRMPTAWQKRMPVWLALYFLISRTVSEFILITREYFDFKVQPLLPWMHSKTGPGIAGWRCKRWWSGRFLYAMPPDIPKIICSILRLEI